MPAVWNTAVNATCKYLMVDYAFTVMGMHKVWFSLDVNNERTLRAMRKLGASEEGYLREEMRWADGSFKDVILFAISKTE